MPAPAGAIGGPGGAAGRPPADRSFVHGDVVARRAVPGEILLHAVADEGAPQLVVAEGRHRALDRLQQGLRRVVLEHEPRRRAMLQRLGRHVDDGVRQPADAPDDRHRAEAHAVHLVQPAGLKPRGHEERVRPRFDLMGQGVVEAQVDRELLRKSCRQGLQLVMVGGIAGAEDDDLDRQRHQRIDGLREDVDPLLLRQALDHADHQHVMVRQLLLLLQRELANRFAGHLSRPVVRGQRGVGLRIPFLRVDAVENPDQRLPAGSEHALEAAADLGGLDFLRVGGADRRQQVGGHQPALQAVDLPVELQPLDAEERLRQIRERPALRREHALVGEVVHGQHGADRLPEAIGRERPAQVGADERRLPVMGMHDLRLPAQLRDRAEDRLREDAEALQVIREVGALVLVEPVAVEQLGLVDEVDRDGRLGDAAFQDRADARV